MHFNPCRRYTSYFGADKAFVIEWFWCRLVGIVWKFLPRKIMVVIGKARSWSKGAVAGELVPKLGCGYSLCVPKITAPIWFLPGRGRYSIGRLLNEIEDDILKNFYVLVINAYLRSVFIGMGLKNIIAKACFCVKELRGRLTATWNRFEALKSGKEPYCWSCFRAVFVFLRRVIGDLVWSIESPRGVYIAGGMSLVTLSKSLKVVFCAQLQAKVVMRAVSFTYFRTFLWILNNPGLDGLCLLRSYLCRKA